MKLLSSLLAIIILVFSCIPCSDAGAVAVAQASARGAAQLTTAATADNSAAHNDHCSPFCQCSCCAVAYTVTFLQTAAICNRPVFIAKVFAAYLQHNPIGITLPIWQPPRTTIVC